MRYVPEVFPRELQIREGNMSDQIERAAGELVGNLQEQLEQTKRKSDRRKRALRELNRSMVITTQAFEIAVLRNKNVFEQTQELIREKDAMRRDLKKAVRYWERWMDASQRSKKGEERDLIARMKEKWKFE
jgi:thymidylate synthase